MLHSITHTHLPENNPLSSRSDMHRRIAELQMDKGELKAENDRLIRENKLLKSQIEHFREIFQLQARREKLAHHASVSETKIAAENVNNMM